VFCPVSGLDFYSGCKFIVISSQKTVREGAVDSVRGVEAAIELYKDPEYGTDRSQLGLFFLSFHFGFLSIHFRFVLQQPLSPHSLRGTSRTLFLPNGFSSKRFD